MMRISLVYTFFLFIILACSDKSIISPIEEKLTLPDVPYGYDQLSLPAGSNVAGSFENFDLINNQPIFSNSRAEITPWGATLGRVLFYDKKLSLNNTVSCASCHHQDKAFADGLQFSTGFEGRITTRNSMAIINPIVQNNLFWDSRSKTIHDLSLQPVQNHIEMGMEDLDRLVNKLENTEYYKPLYKKAFGEENISYEKISKALSKFVASITTSR